MVLIGISMAFFVFCMAVLRFSVAVCGALVYHVMCFLIREPQNGR